MMLARQSLLHRTNNCGKQLCGAQLVTEASMVGRSVPSEQVLIEHVLRLPSPEGRRTSILLGRGASCEEWCNRT